MYHIYDELFYIDIDWFILVKLIIPSPLIFIRYPLLVEFHLSFILAYISRVRDMFISTVQPEIRLCVSIKLIKYLSVHLVVEMKRNNFIYTFFCHMCLKSVSVNICNLAVPD